jgi:hypothetical protein
MFNSYVKTVENCKWVVPFQYDNFDAEISQYLQNVIQNKCFPKLRAKILKIVVRTTNFEKNCAKKIGQNLENKYFYYSILK